MTSKFVKTLVCALPVVVAAILASAGYFFSAAAVVAIPAAVLGAAWLYLRRSLPRNAGCVQAHGLSSPLRIVRDVDGVPHIYAESREDAWFGLGYAHAQDRLWQMEFQRRSGQGRMAELLGRKAVLLDRFMRTVGIHRCAEETWRQLPEPARAAVNAYTSGVNAVVEVMRKRRSARPPEFILFRAVPELWTGVDVVVISKMMAWSLGGTYLTELLRHDLIETLGPERAAQLMPDYGVPKGATATAGLPSGSASALADLEGLEPQLTAGEGAGSNLWAVDGGRSATGAAVLANDPHLASSIPNTWYLAHLSAPGLDVIGATLPGMPPVMIGRNRDIAWGITNLSPDVQDLFRERLNADTTEAEFQGQMEPLQIFRETIHVKKSRPVEIEVRATRHGPLVSEVIEAAAAGNSPGAKPRRREPMALRWTGSDTNDTSLHALLSLNTATNWQSFREALAFHVAPPVNFGFAGRNGDIGYSAAGRIPIRRAGDGSVPAEGWPGENDWAGFIPFDELPSAYNPRSGCLVSTNGSPADDGYPHFLGRDWVEPFRKQRINELLNQYGCVPLAAHSQIQADVKSLHAREIVPILLSLVTASDEREHRALGWLRAWDGGMPADSVEASILSMWMLKLPAAILAAELDGKLAAAYQGWSTYVNRFVINALTGKVPLKEDAGALAQRTLREALDELQRRLGPRMDAWRWSRLHKVLFPHLPLNAIPGLRSLFSRSVGVGGDWCTVNLGGYLAAKPFVQRNLAGYRQIVEMSGKEQSVFIQAVGQSGHFLSKYYDNFLPDWQAVRYRPMRFTRDAVESATAAVLELQP